MTPTSQPTPSTTTNVPITEADQNAIRALVALAQKSQSDPETLPALHTAETVIVNLAGRRVLGRESYATAMADGLASPFRDVPTTAKIVDIRLATPDVAIVSCTKTVHITDPASTPRLHCRRPGRPPTSPSEAPTGGTSPSHRRRRPSQRRPPMSELAPAPRAAR
jgi:uncharacterized protein (TIGR02246 family)